MSVAILFACENACSTMSLEATISLLTAMAGSTAATSSVNLPLKEGVFGVMERQG